jgi:hypothetical protein
VYTPTDPDEPEGSGVAISFSPSDGDPTLVPTREAGEDGGEAEQIENASKPLLAAGDPAGESLEKKQTTRRLRLRNATKAKIVVLVQYRCKTEDNKEKWFPSAKPDGDEKTAMRYEIPAGKTVEVKDNDWPVHASKARVWAEGGGKNWYQFKDNDLDLVPEKDEEDKHAYNATVPQTTTLAFH